MKQQLTIATQGEKFYAITKELEQYARRNFNLNSESNGVLTLFCPHTSCALCINENYDRSAKEDMQNFLKHLAPRQLPFITHTAEGPDDSPSHMKSIVLNTSLQLIVNQGEILLGTWQGVYLCEFRDAPQERQIWINFASN